jgi:putative transposase
VTRFAFVDREKAFYDVTVLCRLVKVSRSGFYAWQSRPKSPRALADEVLTEQIRAAFDANRKVYGSPRIFTELTEDGVHVGRKRIARLMREAGIVGCHRRKRSFSITSQNPKAEAAPDLVDRKFTATAPNQLWVADVTYVPTVQGWLYLACVTDVFSRMVIGWSMASHRKTDLVVDAVTMAVTRRGGHVPGVIHHSDRGGEYTSHALERELRKHGALASMGSVADCFDNAMAEPVRDPRVRAVRPAAERPVRDST